MYQKILVPLDGSSLAESALAQLSQLVGPETEVILLRVYEPPAAERLITIPPYSSGGGSSIPVMTPVHAGPSAEELAQIHERIRREAEEYLEGKAEDLLGVAHRRRTVTLEDSDPAGAIASEAQAEEADLIVMSTHGRSGAVRWILGSVADKVVHSTRVPILLVRPAVPAE